MSAKAVNGFDLIPEALPAAGRGGISASIAVSRLKQKKHLPLRSLRLCGAT
jgi:hypothetical protein